MVPAIAVAVLGAGTPSAAVDACAAPANAIVAENCKPGTPRSIWDVPGGGSGAIAGFATDISADQGGTVAFKVDAATGYRLDLYRLGWYGGNGARKVDQIGPVAATVQPACREAATGRVDCANWGVTAIWTVPPDAVSGVYLAHLVGADGAEAHIPFVVRDDDGRSDLLVQTSDTTWQAYNQYGGNSLYAGAPAGRAYAVSYDRPFTTRAYAPEDWLFNAEYPMLRWLERNGYDVSYSTGVDTDRRGAELLEHGAFLSVGHDEYWSGEQRRNVERARDAGVDLAFFSGNEVFWKTRWEDGHRTLVSYKETQAGEDIDPSAEWTGTWRDARSFNAERTTPENALTGTLFRVNSGERAIQVPAADGRLRLWRGTAVGAQAAGATAVLPDRTLGYEWDEDSDNGARPAGLVRLSSTTASGVETLQDEGWVYAPGTATHHLTLHRDDNGAGPDALVFGAGTIQWSWGLDDVHDRAGTPVSPDMQQATANLLADMGAQAASLQSDLQPAQASSDTIAPRAVVDPADTVVHPAPLALTTIHGSAVDAGGGQVGGVEVSLDAGATWHPADGRERWSYTWIAQKPDSVRPEVRAADDSGNLGPPPPDGAAPGGLGGAPAAGAGAGGRARRLVVGPRRVRMSRRGVVRLRVTCPPGRACPVRLRLRSRDRRIAGARATVPAGATRRVALTLRPGARRRVRRAGTLRVTAVARLAGTAAPVRRTIRLLAPRRR